MLHMQLRILLIGEVSEKYLFGIFFPLRNMNCSWYNSVDYSPPEKNTCSPIKRLPLIKSWKDWVAIRNSHAEVASQTWNRSCLQFISKYHFDSLNLLNQMLALLGCVSFQATANSHLHPITIQELSSPLHKSSDEVAESVRPSQYMPNSSWQNQILYQTESFRASLLEAQ